MVSDSNEPPSLTNNRDFLRVNTSNTAVQGSIFATINNSCFDQLEIAMNSLNFADTPESQRIKSLIIVAKEVNKEITSLFYKTQNTINTTSCKRYAQSLQNAMEICVKNRERFDQVEILASTDVVTTKMMTYNKVLFGNECKYYLHNNYLLW